VRLLSDDARRLSLAAQHCDPGAGLVPVLAPLAALFGTDVESQQGVRRLWLAGESARVKSSPRRWRAIMKRH
jgi:hypothetical protein